jgi:FixJ family two-component response regulator
MLRPSTYWRLPNQGELGCILLDVQIPGMDGPPFRRS